MKKSMGFLAIVVLLAAGASLTCLLTAGADGNPGNDYWERYRAPWPERPLSGTPSAVTRYERYDGCPVGSDGTPPCKTIAPPTVEVLQAAALQTPCLLDPARARDEVATIDWSTREVRLTDKVGNAVTVVPAYQTGSGYFGEAYSFPAVSPAGTEIVVGAHFRQKDGSSLTGLWQVDLSDLKRTLLLASDDGKSFALDDPSFSPDGEEIAFTHTNVKWRPTHGHDDTYEVWVMEADGSNPRKVADGGTPRWSNDGKYLSFALLPHDRLSPQMVVDTLRFQPAPDVSISACPP